MMSIRAMVLSATSLADMVVVLVWTAMSLSIGNNKHPVYNKVITCQDVLAQLLASVPVTFCDSLMDVLKAEQPPPLSFFKQLPAAVTGTWGVYLVLLEKAGCPPSIYVGTGTDAKTGVAARLQSYTRNTFSSRKYVPRNVVAALEDGYSITYTGLLVSAPIPGPTDVLPTRLLFLALEAMFTFALWAVKCKTDIGFSMVEMCLWDRHNLPYNGLCSHNPLSESPPGDWTLSDAEMEAMAAEFKERRRVYIKEYHEKAKRDDPEQFLAEKRAQRKLYVARHPDKAAASDKRTRVKALKEKRHYCVVCDYAANTSASLRKHLNTEKHLDNAAGVVKVVPVWRCNICHHTFQRNAGLQYHLKTQRHRDAAALAAYQA